MVAVVDREKCVGCGKCEVACPPEAIMIVDKKAVVDDAHCQSCGACTVVCAIRAIVLE